MPRSLRTLLTMTIAIALALAMTACSSDSSESGESEGDMSESSEGAESSAPVTDEDLAAALVAEYGSAEWYPRVQWIGFDQVLLARVIRVETDLDMGDYEQAGEIGNAVANISESEEAMNIQVISADGSSSTGQSWGSAMGEAMDLPPAPTTADELQSWIDTVYGESGEDWYGHLSSLSVSDTEGGWQGTTVIVAGTDLPDSSDESLAVARRMGEAVTSTGQTITTSYVVKTGSGQQIMSGDLPSVNLSY